MSAFCIPLADAPKTLPLLFRPLDGGLAHVLPDWDVCEVR